MEFTAAELEAEMLRIVKEIKRFGATKVEVTYENLPALTIQVLSNKYKSRLHSPDGLVRCY